MSETIDINKLCNVSRYPLGRRCYPKNTIIDSSKNDSDNSSVSDNDRFALKHDTNTFKSPPVESMVVKGSFPRNTHSMSIKSTISKNEEVDLENILKQNPIHNKPFLHLNTKSNKSDNDKNDNIEDDIFKTRRMKSITPNLSSKSNSSNKPIKSEKSNNSNTFKKSIFNNHSNNDDNSITNFNNIVNNGVGNVNKSKKLTLSPVSEYDTISHKEVQVHKNTPVHKTVKKKKIDDMDTEEEKVDNEESKDIIATNLIEPLLYSRATHRNIDGSKPDYDKLSTKEKIELFDFYENKFNILIKTNKSFDIIKPTKGLSLNVYVKSYETQVRAIEVYNMIQSWSKYIKFFYKLVEICLIKFLKLEFMKGYAESQIQDMPKYEHILMELGESYVEEEDPQDTPTYKLIKVVGIQTLIFVVSSWVTRNFGTTLGNTAKNFLNKSSENMEELIDGVNDIANGNITNLARKAASSMNNKDISNKTGMMDVRKCHKGGNPRGKLTDSLPHKTNNATNDDLF